MVTKRVKSNVDLSTVFMGRKCRPPRYSSPHVEVLTKDRGTKVLCHRRLDCGSS